MSRKSPFSALLPFWAAIIAAFPALGNAHELWIAPLSHQVQAGQPIVAHVKIGQSFVGGTYAYLPDTYRRLEIHAGDIVEPIGGRMGDYPAIGVEPVAEGLNILVLESRHLTVTYDDWARFEGFAMHKGHDWAITRHRQRGLPQTGFSEAYARYAKALVAVGDGAGADRRLGLQTEIVALANPFTDPLPDGLPVQVFLGGQPRPGAQVEVFEKDTDGRVETWIVRADEQGRARVALRPDHRYQLDAVVLREPSPSLAADLGVAWESLWANLTFARPAALLPGR